MIKEFVLTMVFAASSGGGGVDNEGGYAIHADCQAAAKEFVRNTKGLTGVTYARAWCTTKNVREKDEK